jgi:hypothetical protein
MAGNRCGIMEIVADLHMHSTCSDGKYSPGIIVEKVIKAGLSTFALSDHDTLDHIPIINDYILNNLLVTVGSDYHGWDNKISVVSFDIDANYLNNFTELLNK